MGFIPYLLGTGAGGGGVCGLETGVTSWSQVTSSCPLGPQNSGSFHRKTSFQVILGLNPSFHHLRSLFLNLQRKGTGPAPNTRKQLKMVLALRWGRRGGEGASVWGRPLADGEGKARSAWKWNKGVGLLFLSRPGVRGECARSPRSSLLRPAHWRRDGEEPNP